MRLESLTPPCLHVTSSCLVLTTDPRYIRVGTVSLHTAYADLAEVLVRDGVINAPGDLMNRMALVPLKMLIPNVVVGRLIGRGGFNVKRLMAETDAYVICSRDENMSRHAQPNERVLTVMGSPTNQV